jgi:hypothetical protein
MFHPVVTLHFIKALAMLRDSGSYWNSQGQFRSDRTFHEVKNKIIYIYILAVLY